MPLVSNHRRQWIYFGLLAILFSVPLFRWFQAALAEDLHSHVLLIPFITAYLIRLRRREVADGRWQVGDGGEEGGESRGERGEGGEREGAGSWELEAGGGDAGERGAQSAERREGGAPRTPLSALRSPPLFFALGLACAVIGFALRQSLAPVDTVALQMGGLILLLIAGLGWFQGPEFVRRNGFALAFLVFAIPMPTVVEHGLEVFFQNASAEAAAWMFSVTGTTFFRTGLTFEFVNLKITVAQECSGIRSSYVLFIVSLLAGHLLLQKPRNRWVLSLCVIPLGILRNGFRILTISLLTIHWDPGVIHSPLHHRGGPIFFALSLVPMFGLLWWLRRGDGDSKSEIRISKSETNSKPEARSSKP